MSNPITIRQVQLSGDFRHVAHHKFPMPSPGEKGFYRMTNTFNAFFNGSHRRNVSKEFLFSEVDLREGDHRREWEVWRDNQLPSHEHADLLAFFRFIGFDNRTKKYSINQSI